jgi:hypothetical protein
MEAAVVAGVYLHYARGGSEVKRMRLIDEERARMEYLATYSLRDSVRRV